uniref:Uncharacterized protein n=1 Tax=Solanum lycopersicum TaxID=4081 RepID=A0A3Q7I0R0_SOLLC
MLSELHFGSGEVVVYSTCLIPVSLPQR